MTKTTKTLFFISTIILVFTAYAALDQIRYHAENHPHKKTLKLMNLNTLSAHPDCATNVEKSLTLINLVANINKFKDSKNSNKLAKKTLKFILFPEAQEVQQHFNKDQGMQGFIRGIQKTFLEHTEKHFRKIPGNFSVEGRHSVILKNNRENLSTDDIKKIITNVIETGTFSFDTDQVPGNHQRVAGRLIIRMTKSPTANQFLTAVPGSAVYKLNGKHNEPFDYNQANPLKENENLNCFFQLHLAPLTTGALDKFKPTDEGRHGSFYVKNLNN